MSPTLTPFTEIANGIFTSVAEPDSVTIGLILGEEGALIVDTGSTPEQGAAIRAAAESLAKRPVTHVVVTHGHRDHCLGLAAFADCVTIGHASSTNWPTDPILLADAKRLGVTEILTPNRTFNLVTVVDLGGRRVEIVHGGPGHSPSDIVAIVPDADVVFVGDLWEEAGPPVYGPDSDVAEWGTTLDTVMGAFTENTKIIVGHGQPVNRSWALAERMKVGAIPSIVEWLIARGVPLEQADAQTEWPWEAEQIAKILPIAYPQIQARLGSRVRNLPILR